MLLPIKVNHPAKADNVAMSESRRLYQFSIWQLLAATLAVAVISGATRIAGELPRRAVLGGVIGVLVAVIGHNLYRPTRQDQWLSRSRIIRLRVNHYPQAPFC